MLQLELYNTLFDTNSTNGNRKDMLRSITEEHSYFSVAHFYLLKETNNTDFFYKKTAAITALHFNNPLWLNYQLKRKLNNIVEAIESESVENILIAQEMPVVPQSQQVPQPQKVENIPAIQEIEKAEPPDVKPELVPKEELLFEPLYTTDYFASQGIKLSEEVQTNDKLGKQLKSFTDWLKTMKRVQHGKMPEPGPAMDMAVQNLAEKSNKEEEVLTEAMADVYIQQGKTTKAHEIYRKLSLLNPAKSAYFAAKIELLKEH